MYDTDSVTYKQVHVPLVPDFVPPFLRHRAPFYAFSWACKAFKVVKKSMLTFSKE